MAAGTTQMYSNANESSLESVANSSQPETDLSELEYFLYSDLYMTTTKNNGYYSDGTYWYYVSGGSGRITNAGKCSDL